MPLVNIEDKDIELAAPVAQEKTAGHQLLDIAEEDIEYERPPKSSKFPLSPEQVAAGRAMMKSAEVPKAKAPLALETLKGLGREALAIPETAIDFAGGLMAYPIEAATTIGGTIGGVLSGERYETAKKDTEAVLQKIMPLIIPQPHLEETKRNLEFVGNLLGFPRRIAEWTAEEISKAVPAYKQLNRLPKSDWGKVGNLVINEGMDFLSAIMVLGGAGRGVQAVTGRLARPVLERPPATKKPLEVKPAVEPQKVTPSAAEPVAPVGVKPTPSPAVPTAEVVPPTPAPPAAVTPPPPIVPPVEVAPPSPFPEGAARLGLEAIRDTLETSYGKQATPKQLDVMARRLFEGENFYSPEEVLGAVKEEKGWEIPDVEPKAKTEIEAAETRPMREPEEITPTLPEPEAKPITLYRGDMVSALGEKPNILRLQTVYDVLDWTPDKIISDIEKRTSQMVSQLNALEKEIEKNPMLSVTKRVDREELSYNIKRNRELLDDLRKKEITKAELKRIAEANADLLFLSESPEVASTYAMQRETLPEILVGPKPEGYAPRVSEVEITPQKTLDLTGYSKSGELWDYGDIVKTLEALGIKDNATMEEITGNTSFDEGYRPAFIYQLFRGKNLPIIRKLVEEQGYDSVKFKEGDATTWVVLNRDIVKGMPGRQLPKAEVATPPEPEVKPITEEITPQNIPERYHAYLNELIGEVEVSEPARDIFTEEGEFVRRTKSTYPLWMQNKGWTQKEVIRALDKAIKGQKLAKKQATIVDAALEEVKLRRQHEAVERRKKRQEMLAGTKGWFGEPEETPIEAAKATAEEPMLTGLKTERRMPTEPIEGRGVDFEESPLMEATRKAEEERAQPRLDELFREGQEREKQAGQAGLIRLPTKPEVPPAQKPKEIGFVRNLVKKIEDKFKAIIEPFTFYKKAPLEFQNAVRTNLIGRARKLYAEREKHRISLFGGMDDAEISKAAAIAHMRGEVERQKLGKGNPEVTLEEVQDRLANLEKTASAKEIAAANRWKEISKIYQTELIRRGKLDPEDTFEDYTRHYVIDYTPDWAPAIGIPSKLRRPFRGYTKKAVGTTKEYRQDAESLLDYLTEVDADNMLEDFIMEQAEKYDITSTLDRDKKVNLFGVDKAGRVRPYAKAGRIYNIDGKRYRAYSPDKPFTRQIYPTEEGEMAIGREKKTYLLPEEIYNVFENFSPRGSKAWYFINKANAYFKSSAILSVFPRYNINNFIGDTWMIVLQHPKPFKLLSQVDDALFFLIKKPENYTAYDKAFAKFLTDNDILGATFIRELPHIRATRNPLKWLLQKSQKISQFRESILRAANARYLFEENLKGNGEKVRQSFDWINTGRLNTEAALGQIAREIVIDYEATSKTYNRVIRGLLFPFGRWYFKGSQLIWQYTMKHPLKGVGGLLTLPIAGMLLNNRNDEIKKMEMQVPEEVREGFHVVLGRADDGRIRTWNMQTPQDALIGTKIFSVAIAQLNMYLNGEKTLQKAAVDTIKHWGVKEVKGIVYLTSPIVRFLRGLIDRKDPMDNQPLYPFMDVSKMTQREKIWRDTLYFTKCIMPMLSGYISETEGKLKPPPQAIKEVFNKFAGLPALGIRDYNEKLEIVLPDGRKINYEEFERIKQLEQQEAGILLEIKEDFIKSGMSPGEYIASDSFARISKNLWEFHRGHLTEEVKKSLDKRIMNQLLDPTTLKFWYENKIDAAPTDEEKRRLRQEQQKVKTWEMFEKMKQRPESIRPFFLEESK